MENNRIEYNKSNGFSFSVNITQGDHNLTVSPRDRHLSMVLTNYHYWNMMSNFKSANNFDDVYFQEIVRMKEDAVPGILDIITDHPDPIVHALDLIFPDLVHYEGNVSLKDVCELWIITLLTTGKY